MAGSLEVTCTRFHRDLRLRDQSFVDIDCLDRFWSLFFDCLPAFVFKDVFQLLLEGHLSLIPLHKIVIEHLYIVACRDLRVPAV